MDIIVLAGGLSTERDVSFKTGSMVASALRENGHRVILLDVFMGYSDKEENLDEIFERSEEISVKTEDIPETAPDLAAVKASRKDQSPCFFGPNVIRMCQMADIVFMALHGENGENGKIQAAFDLFGIRYTGSDYLSSAIAMDKGMAKQVLMQAKVPVPAGISMKKAERENDITKLPVSLPCVVKPCCGGSSIGVTIVKDAAEFKAALDEGFRWEDELIIEEYTLQHGTISKCKCSISSEAVIFPFSAENFSARPCVSAIAISHTAHNQAGIGIAIRIMNTAGITIVECCSINLSAIRIAD